MYYVYWLISEDSKKTYVGFSGDVNKRIREHRNKNVTSTERFGKFRAYILDKTFNPTLVRKKEKYWKSAAGRKKLKIIYNEIITGPIV